MKHVLWFFVGLILIIAMSIAVIYLIDFFSDAVDYLYRKVPEKIRNAIDEHILPCFFALLFFIAAGTASYEIGKGIMKYLN